MIHALIGSQMQSKLKQLLAKLKYSTHSSHCAKQLLLVVQQTLSCTNFDSNSHTICVPKCGVFFVMKRIKSTIKSEWDFTWPGDQEKHSRKTMCRLWNRIEILIAHRESANNPTNCACTLHIAHRTITKRCGTQNVKNNNNNNSNTTYF